MGAHLDGRESVLCKILGTVGATGFAALEVTLEVVDDDSAAVEGTIVLALAKRGRVLRGLHVLAVRRRAPRDAHPGREVLLAYAKHHRPFSGANRSAVFFFFF